MFERSWKLNKSEVLPETLKKIDIYGVEDLHLLTELIDKEQLPEKYGGKLKGEGYKVMSGVEKEGRGSYFKSESKFESFREESKYEIEESKKGGKDDGDGAYRFVEKTTTTRRLSAVNGLKTLTRRLSQKLLFGFDS